MKKQNFFSAIFFLIIFSILLSGCSSKLPRQIGKYGVEEGEYEQIYHRRKEQSVFSPIINSEGILKKDQTRHLLELIRNWDNTRYLEDPHSPRKVFILLVAPADHNKKIGELSESNNKMRFDPEEESYFFENGDLPDYWKEEIAHFSNCCDAIPLLIIQRRILEADVQEVN